MNTPKNHHYISQCYLKGFKFGKKDRVIAYDHVEGKMFTPNTKNIGSIAYFNRFRNDFCDENFIEKGLSNFESKVAKALKNIKKSLRFEGIDREIILEFIAMLESRNPIRRSSMKDVLKRSAEINIGMILSSKKMFESQLKRYGTKLPGEKVEYQEVRDFYESKKYEIEVPNEKVISHENNIWEKLYGIMHERKWVLLTPEESSGPFITSDSPVCLCWTKPGNEGQHLGHGLKNTGILFPLSPQLMLHGTFNGLEGTEMVSYQEVKKINMRIIMNSERFIYSNSRKFDYLLKEGNDLSEKNIEDLMKMKE